MDVSADGRKYLARAVPVRCQEKHAWRRHADAHDAEGQASFSNVLRVAALLDAAARLGKVTRSP